jgi:hypothetical protein
MDGSSKLARHIGPFTLPTRPSGIVRGVATAPDSTKTSLGQRLHARARERWPQLADIHIRHRGPFSYVTGELPDGTTLPLFRLRYSGSAITWGFAIYRASHEDYRSAIPHWLQNRATSSGGIQLWVCLCCTR